MKLGFTGTQHGMTERQQLAVIKFFNFTHIEEFHHGDCIGADEQAHEIACDFNVPKIIIHPPIKDVKRAFCSDGNYIRLPKKDYLDRNRDIVDATDVLLACPKTLNEELRSGTWSTIRYARKLKKVVWILEP